jgi:hypothetical protein
MKKVLLLISLLCVVVFTSAFSVVEWRDSIYQQIKTETIKALKDNLKKDVSIGKVEGRIVGQVVFHDVIIPGFAKAKKIYVNYGLIKFAYKRDVIPAISKITIVGGDFEVRRDRSDRLNVLHLLPEGEPGGPPPPPFRAKLIFKNCRVNYRDYKGFRKSFAFFGEKMRDVNGSIDFGKKDRIKMNLSGKIDEKPSPTIARIKASVDFKKEKFKYTISAQRLDLKKWGNYLIAFDPLSFKGGKVNLSLTLSTPKIQGRPFSINGDFSFFNASAELGEFVAEKTSGKMLLNDQGLTLKDSSTEMNGLRIKASGQLLDFARQNLDFTLSFNDGDLRNLVSIFPQTRNLDLSGRGNASFRLHGTVLAPKASGKISVRPGKFYAQEFSGNANFNFSQKLLKIDIPNIRLKKGSLAGSCQIDFSKESPTLLVNSHLKEVDLASAAQDVPGIAGSISGELTLAGPLNKLRGELSADLSQAEFLGQPIEKTSARFIIKDGEVLLEHLTATSKTALIRSSGTITRDLNFDFRANAQGIELSGKGLLGKMEATVDSFEGSIGWKLDEAFIASPLKKLKAAGKIALSNGQIGEQSFDLATGNIHLGDGLLRIEDVTFKRKESSLKASGQTGLGYPTHLEITGEQIDLEDLKIANIILPKEAKNPGGKASINILITGDISRETHLTSFDPLLDLNASGEVSLINGKLADLKVNRCAINFKWQNRTLSFPECILETPNSKVNLNLTYENGKKLKGSLTGIIDFFEFRKFTTKYGRLGGKLGLNLVAEGPSPNPNFAATFWIDDFRLNDLEFKNVEGSLAYSQNILTVTKPLVFRNGENEFKISGRADLSALQTEKPDEAYLDLGLEIIQAELSSALRLIEKINNEYSRRFYAPTAGGKARINLAALALPSLQQFTDRGRLNLYRKNGKTEYFLKTWNSLYRTEAKAEIEPEEDHLGGALKGKISLRGKINNLSGKFKGEVEEGFYQNYAFDKLQLEASLRGNQIKIEKLELAKKMGKLSAQGEISGDGKLDLKLIAKSMPLDILKIFFDQEFKGEFNMRAALAGRLEDPQLSASVSGKNLTFSGVHFDKASIALTKTNGHIFIHEFSLQDDGNLSSISGTIDLSPPGSLNLEARLKDNAVGLFNLVSKDVKWVRGKADASLKIQGPLLGPRIDGELSMKDAAIYVKAIDSEIKKIKGGAKIENNLAKIPALTGIWQGERTKGYQNFVGLAGSIDLSRIFSENKMVTLNLALSPSQFYVTLPNLFTGAVSIKKAHLFGPLSFDLSSGPTLVGQAEVNNAIINVSKRANGKKKIFPLTYDLDLVLDQNVYVVMGDVATFDLSNIFMSLEIMCDDLKLTGTSAHPSLLGKIALERGTVTIFNREFSLLSHAQQEKYYLLNPDKIKDNIAHFTGEKGEEGIRPDVTITAKVDVEEAEEDESGELNKKKVTILSRLKGVIGATDQERGLQISFDSFVENRDKKPLLASYSEQEVKVMLLPDFIKSLTGVSKGEEVDANLVVADYISSRFQTFIFRGIERELEQRFGLESLTLEYNFGKDIRQAMGVTEKRLLEEERPDWRVGFVKGFFDKFYLDVKYSQANLETGRVETYLNYELTYKLSPIWSIIYYRDPSSPQELISGDEKITLKAGFSFW